ncbi:MAG: hypothetical protein K2K88_01220 [Muribaculaceae bacterium]|nr:hypothetical protein [Muribaculaceae bacterium]MDE6351752.1 hypothetical protein [Muribaculaceae bacterium]MDE7092409.1 hypothetical protein [Muribaculaceae bacterium]
MKKGLKNLWILLALAFVVFFALSIFDIPEICGYKPKSSELADVLFEEREHEEESDEYNEEEYAEVVETDSDTILASDPQSIFPVPADTTTQTILFIGDSMLDGLSPRLAAYSNQSGFHQYSVIWYSSTSEKWSKAKRVKEYIEKINPTFIFICLGSNELMVKDIIEKRQQFVSDIIDQIGNIPYLWIGPPNWREDTGINRLIQNNVPEGCYFRSAGMKFERRKDGAHPTLASASLWMDSIIRWMPEHSAHPISFEIPEKKTGKVDHIFIHSPSED